MKTILIALLLALAAPAGAQYYGIVPGTSSVRLQLVGALDVFPSSFTTAGPNIVLHGPNKRITVREGAQVTTITAGGFYGPHYGSGAGLSAIPGSAVDTSTITAYIGARLAPVTAALSTAAYTTASYANPAWITSLATNKVDLSTVTAAHVLKTGDTMSGQLTLSSALTLAGSSLTLTSSAMSVAGTTFTINNGGVGIGANAPTSHRLAVGASDRATSLYVTNSRPTGTNNAAAFSAFGNGAGENIGATFLAQDGTNNKAIYISGPAAGANNYAIKSDATAQSEFAGSISATSFSGSAAGLTSIPSTQLIGGISPVLVDLSTITTALAGKLSSTVTVPGSLINLSTYTFGGGGGVSVSTFTLDLHSGGDVFIASVTFAPNMGMVYVVDNSTWHITGGRCYTVVSSTWHPTSFNIARSTDTALATGWNYIFTSSITVQQNSKYSDWVVPDPDYASINILPAALSLHTIKAQDTGTMPSEYGCVIRYWRRLD